MSVLYRFCPQSCDIMYFVIDFCMSRVNMKDLGWMNEIVDGLATEDRQRAHALFDCLFSSANFKPRPDALYSALTRLCRLFRRALNLLWTDFDVIRVRDDERVISLLIDSLANFEPSCTQTLRLNTYKHELRAYPVFVSLTEAYDLAYTDEESSSLYFIHFVLFARKYYQNETPSAALIDFYRFVSKTAQFIQFELPEESTQLGLLDSYLALRDSVESEHHKKLLRKKLFLKRLPLSSPKKQAKVTCVAKDYIGNANTHSITSTRSVTVEDVLNYEDDKYSKIKSEVEPREYYSIVSHESLQPVELEQVRIDLLQGSRLNLLDSLHLPLSTLYLRDDEARLFINQLKSEFQSLNPGLGPVVALLMLLTAKSEVALEKLVVQMYSESSQDTHEHLDLERGLWCKPSLVLNDAFQPNAQQAKWLELHTTVLRLSLPQFLVAELKLHMKKKGSIQCFLGELIDEPVKSVINTLLKKVPTNRILTTAKLRSFLFLKLAYRLDAQSSMCILNAAEFDNTHHLYYLASKETELISGYYDEVIGWLGVDSYKYLLPQSQAWVGSQNVLSLEQFQSRIQTLFRPLHGRLKSLPRSEAELIQLWNELNSYCALMSVSVCNHRIRQHYMFTSNTVDIENGWFLVCDKHHHHDSAIRILPMPPQLQEQLRLFQVWRERILQALQSIGVPVVDSLCTTGEVPFFTVISNLEVEPLGHTHLFNYLGKDWQVPLNVFRHYFAQSARHDRQARKWVKGLMGHVNGGQHLLSHYSLMSLDDLGVLTPWLDRMLMEELGFEILPNARAVKVSQKKRIQDTHGVVSLSVGQLLKWVRQAVEPYWASLKHSHAFADVQREVIRALMNHSEKEEIGIPSHQRAIVTYLCQRFFVKLASRLNAPLTTFHNVLIDEENLSLSNLLLSDRRLAQQMTGQLSRLLETLKTERLFDKLVYVVLRSLIYSPLHHSHQVKSIADALAERNFGMIDGLMFLKITEHERLYLDPIASTILLDSERAVVNREALISKVNQQLKKVFDKKVMHLWLEHYMARADVDERAKSIFKSSPTWTYDEVHFFFYLQRWSHLSSVTNAYQSGAIKSFGLSHQALSRLLTDKRYDVAGKARESVRSLLPVLKNSEKEKAHVIKCLKNITSSLDALPTMPTKQQLGECILESWKQVLRLPLKDAIPIKELRERTMNEYPLVVAMSFEYLYLVSQRRGHKNRNISRVTIKEYRGQAVLPCLLLLWELDLESLEHEEFEEGYASLVSTIPASGRQAKAERLRDFHKVCQDIFHLPAIRWHIVEPTLNREKIHLNNANLVTHKHYHDALTFIQTDESLTITQRQLYALMLVLCYRLGLRPSEAWALEPSNFTDDMRFVEIRTNRWNRLKTPAANRQIPAGLLLDDGELERLKSKIAQATNRTSDQRLFYSAGDKDMRTCTGYLTRLLKYITGDNTVTLYHCRHSFANYLFLILTNAEKTGVSAALSRWARADSLVTLLAFRRALLVELVGDAYEWQKGLFALARLMGHRHPKTTLTYYIHVLDLQMYIEQARSYSKRGSRSVSPSLVMIDREKLANWVALSSSAFRQRLSREKAIDWKFSRVIAMSPASENWLLPSLPDLTLTESGDVYHLLSSPEEKLADYLYLNHLLHQYLFRDNNRLTIETSEMNWLLINSVSKELKISLFVNHQNDRNYFTNNIKPKSLLSYRDKPVVFELLKRMSLLSDNERKELVYSFIETNHSNALYLNSDEYECHIKNISKLLGLTYEYSHKTKRIRVNNRLEQHNTVSFFMKGKRSSRSVDQQLAYVFVITQWDRRLNVSLDLQA